MKTALFIYNPMAGDHGIAQKVDSIIKKFQNNGIMLQPVRLSFEKKFKLSEIMKKLIFDFIIVSGGDGTVNYVVNAMMKSGKNVSIGIIPAGTSNDLSRCLSLPSSMNESMDIILGGKSTKIDAGVIDNQKYFLTTCAGGLFVDVSFNTNTELKRNFGLFAYYLQALTEIANIKPFEIKLKTERETIEEKILLFVVLNGKHAAGFNNLKSDADMSDGIMDVVLIKNCNQIDLVGMFFKVLNSGTFEDKNMIKTQASECAIDFKQNINMSIDGEESYGMPLKIKFEKQLLEFFVK